MTHEVVLHGYNVKPGSLQLGTFDSYGIEKIHVTADDEWAGLDILAVFHAPDGTATKVVVGADSMLAVPPEATAKQAGVGRIVFVGLTENVQRITVDMGYNIKPHSDIEGENPGTPTPDVVQQILENSNHAVSIATAAQEAAENARQAAEDAAKKAGDGAGGAAASAAAAKKSAEDAAASSKSAASKAEAAESSANTANESAKAAQTAQGSAENAAQTAADAAGDAGQVSENKEAVSQLKEDTAALKKHQNVLVGSETGNPISCNDAYSATLCGLTVYGKSTQDGTPTPDAPVPIVSAGDGGTVVVTLGDGGAKTKTITLFTPGGLPGIPVTSGGNYTDQNGQQWICDEVDLERGIYIKRVAVTVLTVDMIQTLSSSTNDYCITIRPPIDYKYTVGIRVVLMSNRFRYEKNIKNKGVIFGYGNQIRLYVDPNEIKTLDAAKEFIKKNKIEIMYEVNKHVETPLTPAELTAYKALTAYAPTTVLQATDGAGIRLEYQRDVNIVIKNLEDALASMTTT